MILPRINFSKINTNFFLEWSLVYNYFMTKIAQDLQQDSLKVMYQKHGISYLGLFGSYARGEENTDSDVDLLIDFKEGEKKSLFDLADMKIQLEDTLNKKVDIAMRGRVKKILEPYILKDLVTLYEKN